MEHTELKKLLKKFKKQTCTSEEKQLLYKWFSDEKNEDQFKETLLDDINNFKVPDKDLGKVDFQSIYQKIDSKIDENESKYDWNHRLKVIPARGIAYLVKIAAVILFFIAAGGTLSYLLLKEHNANVCAYSEINVPLGARSEVVLPDGSNVWLNAGSTIKYQNLFNRNNRQILLEGEAYFKVAKNTKLPFVVKTGDLNIVAVGTEFNVKAYSEEGIIETTLVEGKVSIHKNRQRKKSYESEVFLEPSQKAVYVKDRQELRIEEINNIKAINPEIIEPESGILYVASKIDPLPIISWKDNKLIFKSEELSSLAVKLERKYNISIFFHSDDIKLYRFTGTLEDETLTQVLDVIKLTAPIDYKLEGKKVEIFENTKMTKKFIHYLKRNQEN